MYLELEANEGEFCDCFSFCFFSIRVTVVPGYWRCCTCASRRRVRWGAPDSGGDLWRVKNRCDGLHGAGKSPKCFDLSECPKC